MELKCGANGDGFTFRVKEVEGYLESEGLDCYLQEIADTLGLSCADHFDPNGARSALYTFIDQFKDGVSDAMILGKRADVNLTSAYKQGYDFGTYLEKKISDQEQKYAENGIGGLDD